VYVNERHSTVVSSVIELEREFATIDDAKIMAMDVWDNAEVERVALYNIKLAVFYARKRLARYWLKDNGQHEQAKKSKVAEEFSKFYELVTTKSLVDAAARFAQAAADKLLRTSSTRYGAVCSFHRRFSRKPLQ
jgi:hypothetical protein